jgi:hypothetical protein
MIDGWHGTGSYGTMSMLHSIYRRDEYMPVIEMKSFGLDIRDIEYVNGEAVLPADWPQKYSKFIDALVEEAKKLIKS